MMLLNLSSLKSHYFFTSSHSVEISTDLLIRSYYNRVTKAKRYPNNLINESEDFNMDQKMFCFQCEQTAGCTGCTGKAGVCGKTADTVVLTLACGKYRFNDLDLGTIGGLPRLMDVGQCNDAYSAIQIALALAGAFNCGVNDLPLSMVLSWYEQKAVCILLTLLHLDIKNIRLGPTLPAFISPNVLNYLVENFGIAPISTPEEDLKQLLK